MIKKSLSTNGFTLLEVVISTAIVSVLVAAVYLLQNFVLDQQQITMNSYISVDYANSAMQTMVRDLRNARFGADGSFILQTANDQELVFFSDVDFDQVTEKVRYFLDGNELKRGITKPSSYPINYPPSEEKIKVINTDIRNATQPIFYYYNSDWPKDTTNNPLPANQRLSQTRLIKISLIVNSSPNQQNTNYQLDSFVQLRTLKDNL